MKQKKAILLLAVLALLAGCQQEIVKPEGATDNTVVQNFPTDGVIRIAATVEEAVATRAGMTTESLQGFGLFVVPLTTDLTLPRTEAGKVYDYQFNFEHEIRLSTVSVKDWTPADIFDGHADPI